MIRYAAVIETGEHNLSAYVPDLPGCVTTGNTLDEIQHKIREAIAFHIEGLREDGAPIPTPHTSIIYVDLADAHGPPAHSP